MKRASVRSLQALKIALCFTLASWDGNATSGSSSASSSNSISLSTSSPSDAGWSHALQVSAPNVTAPAVKGLPIWGLR